MILARLQAAYRDYLLSGNSAAVAPAIVADAFDASERLGIHRNNFLISLRAALKANFPVTLRLVGNGFFEQAAYRFALAHPPQRPCLFEYGAAFPDYLQALPELAAVPYVADVARFEFARVAACHAPAEEYVSADSLAGLEPERLDAVPVRLARHARVVAVTAPVLELWKAHRKPEADLTAIDMAPRSHALLVCRPEHSLLAREIDTAAALFLAAAGAGSSLGLAAAQCHAQGDAALGRVIRLALELRLLANPGTP
ncbi:MAG TPA: DNA-binding domain-containing protein [Dongiaceae bacterium]|nr:DNA-binding domain-containing protein [Dongiaceae bacterium]